MRSGIDLNSEEGLKQFSELATEILNTNIQSITTEFPEVELADTAYSAPEDLLEGFEGGVIITASEEKTGFETGLIFKTADITKLADLMLMGEGESKNELDDELKDAVTEIANQFFGALSGALDSSMGKKLAFTIDDAGKFMSAAVFQSDNYITFDFKAIVKGAPVQFRQYMDESFISLLTTQSSMAPSMPDFFGGATAGGGGSSNEMRSHNSPNMDMLIDIEIPISVRMGSAKLFLKDILGLGPGNIVELDQNADESIELTVNDKVIARGEVVIVDGYFGFRIKEIISKAERIKRLKD